MQTQEVRHFVPAPGRAVLTTEYRERSEGGIWLPDTAVYAECTGTVLGIGALQGADIPLLVGDRVTYAPYAPQEFTLGDGTYTMVNLKDIFTIQGKEQRIPLLYDYRLPPGSSAGENLAWLLRDHLLIRPYSPIGFKTIRTTNGENKKLFLERDEKHPRIWAWVLAVRHDTWKQHGIYPGDFVTYKRHSEELLGHEKPRHAKHRQRLPIAITHISNVEALLEGEDTPHAEF